MAKKTRLIVFDYDGPIVSSDGISYSIMLQALQHVFGVENIGKLNMGDVFRQTRGTTELNLFNKIADLLKINKNRGSIFLDFINTRTRLIEETSRIRGVDRFDEGHVHPDALELMREMKADPEYHTVIAIATGNPTKVMDARLPSSVSALVDFIVGGESAKLRNELLAKALKIAKEKHYFVPEKCSYGHSNAFYVEDVNQAAAFALLVGLRPIYVIRESQDSKLFPIESLEDMRREMTKALTEAGDRIYNNPNARASLFFLDSEDPDPTVFFMELWVHLIGLEKTNQLIESMTKRGNDLRDIVRVTFDLMDPAILSFLQMESHRTVEGSVNPMRLR